MSDVTIVGAGLAGLTAAINCARAGHRVRVLERYEGIGGIDYVRPTIDVTPMDPRALGRFIGVELIEPHVVPTHELVGYIYGKRYSFSGRMLNLYSVERGPRETSLDHFLYRKAVEEGVEFEFGRACLSREDLASLPPDTIVATGLYSELFLAMNRPCLEVFGFVAKTRHEGPPRIIASFNGATSYYFYCANQNGVAFALAFDRRPIPESVVCDWERELREEGILFGKWIPHRGVVATRTISAPRLFCGDKILAGTVAGFQDPFALFGVHGSLVSGKVAAMAVDDKARAWRLFRAFTSSYSYSWLAKKLFDLQPAFLRRVGLNLGVAFWNAHQALFQPLLNRVCRAVPGYGKL